MPTFGFLSVLSEKDDHERLTYPRNRRRTFAVIREQASSTGSDIVQFIEPTEKTAPFDGVS